MGLPGRKGGKGHGAGVGEDEERLGIVGSGSVNKANGDGHGATGTNGSRSGVKEPDAASEQRDLRKATINLSKICIGGGVLALPFAFVNGGALFSVLGLAVVAGWNEFAVQRMLRSEELIAAAHHYIPSNLTNSYSRIAFGAMRNAGVLLVDSNIIIVLLGVCVTYQITAAQLAADIPIEFNQKDPETARMLYTLISGLIAYPLTLFRDLSFLANVSLIALGCLFVSFGAMFYFGLSTYGLRALHEFHPADLWPADATAFSKYFGVAVFCFGVPALAFQIKESMKFPKNFSWALRFALATVWCVYVVVGDGVAIVYSEDTNGVQGNILLNLPSYSIVATIVRVAISLTCVLSVPMAALPASNMLELLFCHRRRRKEYEPLHHDIEDSSAASAPSAAAVTTTNTDPSSKPEDADAEREHVRSIYNYQTGTDPDDGVIEPDVGEDTDIPPLYVRVWTRGAVMLMTTVAAAFVPCFGLVVSLLGCFSVNIISFVLPPLFHYFLCKSTSSRVVDIIALVAGLVTCVFTTAMTFSSMITQLTTTHTC